MRKFVRTALGNTGAEFALLLFFIFFGIWLVLHFVLKNVSSDTFQLWGATYQVIAWYGAISGLVISRRWGGYKSIMGRAVLAFALGLFCQGFGQTVYSAYVYFLRMPIPYPSIGDLGFFGSIPLYAYGAYLLARASGAKISLRAYHNRIIAIVLPVLLLLCSYFLFLQNYQFDWTQPLKIFLDFGYPLGQAFYVAIAILAYILSRKVLGGMMRLPIMLFIAALVVEYFADFFFIYQANAGTFYSGGSDDMIYVLSYTMMVLALFCIAEVHKQIVET